MKAEEEKMAMPAKGGAATSGSSSTAAPTTTSSDPNKQINLVLDYKEVHPDLLPLQNGGNLTKVRQKSYGGRKISRDLSKRNFISSLARRLSSGGSTSGSSKVLKGYKRFFFLQPDQQHIFYAETEEKKRRGKITRALNVSERMNE